MKIIISWLSFIFFISCNSGNNDFKLCLGIKHPYYSPTLEYTGGFYAIKKNFYSNYKNVKSLNDSGIVKIRFQINCSGKSGNYSIETYSLDYKRNIIDAKIKGQLLSLTKDLTKWIPAHNENGENVNSHKFFAFKIIDGSLKDILPK